MEKGVSDMKQLKYRDLKNAAYIFGFLGLLVCVHVISVYIFAVHKFSVIYDANLSDKARKDMHQYLKVSKAYAMPSDTFADMLQSSFTCIGAISCRYKPNGTVEIIIQADKPCMALEHDRVVTTKNYIVPADYYIPEVLAAMPLIKVFLLPDAHRLPNDVFCYIRNINTLWLAHSTISWKHYNEIHMVFAQHKLQLLCSNRKVPDQKLLDDCLAIVHKTHDMSSEHDMLADVRFADQIIISQVKN